VGHSVAPVFRPLTFRRGFVHSARFAPDGQTIVYSAAWDGNPLEIFTTRRDGAESRSLGLARGSSIQSISREGELAIIVGGCDAPTPVCADGVLARLPLAGGAPRDVLEHVQGADWSPDGQNLAVIHNMEGTSRLEYPMGHVLYAAPTGAQLAFPRFSHGGERIAVVEIRADGLRSVSVFDLEGHRRQITPGTPFLLLGLNWSPRDDELWYTNSTAEHPPALYASTLAGNQRLIERLPEAFVLKDLAADGTILAMTSTPRWFRIVGHAPGDVEDRDLSMFNNPELGDLSSDGRTMAFDATAYGVKRGVYLRRLDGSPAVRLGDGDALALSPDGKWVLSWTKLSKLVLLPTGPGEPRPLSGSYDDYRWAFWLPDGRWFVIDAREPGRAWRGYLHDVIGGAERPITPEQVEPFLVSPDGMFILASGLDRANSMALYPIDGGTPRPVHGLDRDDTPVQWSSNPNELYVRGPELRPARVFRFNLKTGRKTPWRDLTPPDPAGLIAVGRMDYERSLCITPDGRAYVYKYYRDLSDLFLVSGLR
jgi:Tol biopolymer transport system component